MKTSQQGIVALVIHEGIVPGPYRDSVGVWTYGVGHTFGAGPPYPAHMARGMPADLDKALRDVFALFVHDLAKYERDVTRALRVPVAQYEFDALVSFHYNTGAISRAKITSHLNAGFRLKAAAAFMSWSKPVEIIPRRKAEQALFASGTYPQGRATFWGVTPAGGGIWRPQRTLSASDIAAMMGSVAPTGSVVDQKPPVAAPIAQPRPAPHAIEIPATVRPFWAALWSLLTGKA